MTNYYFIDNFVFQITKEINILHYYRVVQLPRMCFKLNIFCFS